MLGGVSLLFKSLLQDTLKGGVAEEQTNKSLRIKIETVRWSLKKLKRSSSVLPNENMRFSDDHDPIE